MSLSKYREQQKLYYEILNCYLLIFLFAKAATFLGELAYFYYCYLQAKNRPLLEESIENNLHRFNISKSQQKFIINNKNPIYMVE